MAPKGQEPLGPQKCDKLQQKIARVELRVRVRPKSSFVNSGQLAVVLEDARPRIFEERPRVISNEIGGKKSWGAFSANVQLGDVKRHDRHIPIQEEGVVGFQNFAERVAEIFGGRPKLGKTRRDEFIDVTLRIGVAKVVVRGRGPAGAQRMPRSVLGERVEGGLHIGCEVHLPKPGAVLRRKLSPKSSSICERRPRFDARPRKRKKRLSEWRPHAVIGGGQRQQGAPRAQEEAVEVQPSPVPSFALALAFAFGKGVFGFPPDELDPPPPPVR